MFPALRPNQTFSTLASPLLSRRSLSRPLDPRTDSLPFIGGIARGVSRYANGVVVSYRNPGEWLGNHESIPGLQPPRAAGPRSNGHHRRARALRDHGRSGRDGAGRSTWTVDRDGEIMTGLDLATRPEQRARRAARRRAANRPESQCQSDARDDLSVAVLGDDDGDIPVAVAPQERQEAAMPQHVDDASSGVVHVAHHVWIEEPDPPCFREGAQNQGAEPAAPRDLSVARRVGGRHAILPSARSRAISATRFAAPGAPSARRTPSRSSSMRVRSALAVSSSGRSAAATRSGCSACWMNSRATSRPATTLTSPMYGIFTSRRAAAYVSGCVRYATTCGQPATDASSVVVPLLHIAASAARRIWNDASRTIGNGHRLVSITT